MKNHYFGTLQGERLYYQAPSWDCGWYWGFGYLSNSRTHLHLNSFCQGRNLRDGLRQEFSHLALPEKELWTFCELAMSAYTLKETAELFTRGGSNYTLNNPVRELLSCKEKAEHINQKLLPVIFREIDNLFSHSRI